MGSQRSVEAPGPGPGPGPGDEQWPVRLGPGLVLPLADHADMAELINVASHEMRGPLHGLGLLMHLLERSLSAGREVDPTLFLRGRRLMGRAVRLLDEVLELSRIRDGRFDLVMQPVELRRLVEDAVRALALEAERAKDLRLILPEAPVEIRGDRARLQQAVAHLVENATEYAPEGTPVHITLRALPEGGAEIEVTDEGPGLEPAELLANLGRVHARAGHSGLGVGLYLCAYAVEQHGGTLLLQPTNQAAAAGRPDAQGLRVLMRIPAAPPSQQPS